MIETVGFPWTWAQISVLLVILSETFASDLTLACLRSLIYKMDIMTDMERTKASLPKTWQMPLHFSPREALKDPHCQGNGDKYIRLSLQVFGHLSAFHFSNFNYIYFFQL